jgi:hypothetical protein
VRHPHRCDANVPQIRGSLSTYEYKFDGEQVLTKTEAVLSTIIELVKLSSPSLDLNITRSIKETYNKLGPKLSTYEDTDWIDEQNKQFWKATLSRLGARSSQK